MLASKFKKDSSHRIYYDMLIQPESLYETPNGSRGTYVDTIYSNGTGKWFRWIYETFSNGLLHTMSNDSYTGFWGIQNNSISFSLNLANITSPNQYLLSFAARDYFHINGKSCNLVDETYWYPIPRPIYSIVAIPSSISLRPGEGKPVDLMITYPIPEIRWNYNSTLILSYPQHIHHLEISPKNATISVPSHGVSTAIIYIKAPGDIYRTEQVSSIHPIPISTTIKIIDFSLYGSGLEHLKSHSLTDHITTTFSNLTVTLSPSQSFQEKLPKYIDIIKVSYQFRNF